MRKLNLRIAAIFLLLLLIQCPAMRLMVHNTLHKNIVSHPLPGHSGNFQTYCDCLDEALMPSTETPVIGLVVPQGECIVLENNFRVFLSSSIKIFHALRGPPHIPHKVIS